MKLLLATLLAAGLAAAPALSDEKKSGETKQDKKEKKEQKEKRSNDESDGPAEPRDINREMSRILRELQFSLEGGSARGLLSLIDSEKFDDYPRFEDTVERLMREDTLRAHFRTVSSSVSAADARGQTILDAEMELTRKDGAGQVQRRRQQLVLDFERTRRGWRIVNITPRSVFEPL